MSWRTRYGINRRRWAFVRKQALERDGWRCVNCGRSGRLEVDHIKPLHLGGQPYRLQNLQCLCKSCHSRKTANDYGRELPPERKAWRDRMARKNYLRART